MQIATDTATLIIYDLDQLKHRMNDELDWWSNVDEEIEEINIGHALFVGLAEDGLYDINIKVGPPVVGNDISVIQANLHNTSGLFFVGPGESVTADGEEPGESRYSHFYEVLPGDYEVTVTSQEHTIFIWLTPAQEFLPNKFEVSPLMASVLTYCDNDLFKKDYNMSDEDEMANDNKSITSNDNDKHEIEADDYDAGDPGLVEDEALALVVESICGHLEILGYEVDSSEDDLLFFHEEYGDLLVEEYAGGMRFATTMEYDSQRDLKLMPYEEWRGRLLDVLDHFNASASVARAYDNAENEEVVLDCWYPAFYSKPAFNRFIELWHDDITVQFEEAQEEVSETRVTH
ncbi:hypothetical protein MNBD_GAMMA12-702 [hydrothermal vent metagenome]|uniref:Uncharacterized protein n=1 Tax=hydrothermal vent metagenome TaxID=652676 RepID=A0A3B0YY58_9ZZZZ